MPRKKIKRGKPDAKKAEDPRHRLDKALEEGLEGTFPASDAVAGSVLSGWLSGGQTC
jgi:hypothetical protein